MAVIINWDSPTYNTIRIGFEGDWGWLGLRNKMRTVFALMQKSPTATDLIFDFTYSGKLPPNPIENFDSLRYHLPANLGTIAMIVPDADMREKLLGISEPYAVAGLRLIITATQTDVQHLLNDIHHENVIAHEWA